MSSNNETTNFSVNTDDYTLIEINKILMTKPINEAVKFYGGSIKGFGFKGAPGHGGFALSRMNRMIDAFNNQIELSPVIIREHKSTGYYIIVDGRHRFASSILSGYTHIPCQFN